MGAFAHDPLARGARLRSRAPHWLLAAASFAALVGAAPVAGASEPDDASASPEVPRDERGSPADDGDGRAVRRRGRKRRRRAEQPPPEDDWLTTTGTNRFGDRFYDLGVFTGAGGPVAGPGLSETVGLTGVRVMENHGYLSKFLVFTLLAMGMSNQAYVGSSYSTDASGNVWRTDYYRNLTPEEQAAQQEALSSAVNAEYVMELNVYTRGLWGFTPGAEQAGGFEWYLGGETVLARGRVPAILQIAGAISWLNVRQALFAPGEGPRGDASPTAAHREDYDYFNVGVMLRAIIPINEWIETFVQWDINVLSFFDVSLEKWKKDGNLWASPLRVGGVVNLTDRAYVRGFGSVNVPGGFGLGWGSELGVRF